MTHTSCVVR